MSGVRLPVQHPPEPGIAAAQMVATLPTPVAILIERAGAAAVIGRSPAFAALGLAIDRATPLAAAVLAMLREGRDAPPRGFRWCAGDGVAARHFEVHLSRADAAIGEPACFVSLVDRTAEVETARSLRAELNHDSLTGLPNRTAFDEAVEEAIGRGKRHAVLLVDLARFGRINDSLGVTTGDETLITVARRLLGALRAGDCMARVGGNEFAILLRLGDARDEAVIAARRVRAVLARPFRLAAFEIGLECAIGVALSDHAGSADEIVRHAQIALKRAKATGRIELHEPDDAAAALDALDIETELRRAIAGGGLTLAYQPIVHLSTGRATGFEALARWNHPVRGAISPAHFIAVAEESGLIVPLGRWALETALATLADWDARAGRALPVSISVNVSAIQLARDDVPGIIACLLAQHGLSGARLTVELTESAIVLDPARTTRALEALKALDVRVAMDDFGTGYSSLANLRYLPIDVLKIDSSFVTGMLADRDKVAIVRAVLSLADALGKTTTAEGVETAELVNMLSALGCTHGQGYLFARALPADAAFRYLESEASAAAM